MPGKNLLIVLRRTFPNDDDIQPVPTRPEELTQLLVQRNELSCERRKSGGCGLVTFDTQTHEIILPTSVLVLSMKR